MRQGEIYTLVIYIPQNFTTQLVRWKSNLKFYALHLLKNCATLSLQWGLSEPPPTSSHE